MANGNKINVSDILTPEEIRTWKPGDIVLLEAQTGSGKTFFAMNNLYDLAVEHNWKILFLIHRTFCKKQFEMELSVNKKTFAIDIVTYQSIQNIKDYGNQLERTKYDIIFADEAHYFISDATFNDKTDVAYDWLIQQENAIRIFMTATGQYIKRYMMEISHLTPIQYKLPYNWDYIEDIQFYWNEDVLFDILDKIHDKETDSKAIIFMRRGEDAARTYNRYRKTSTFICSEHSRKSYKSYMNAELVGEILQNECFDSQFLIATMALSTGINIKDKAVRYIFIDQVDYCELLQCLGRKRIIDDTDTVKLFVKMKNNQELGGYQSNCNQQILQADFLREHGEKEFVSKFGKIPDFSCITYDSIDKERNVTIKKINQLKYCKKKWDIEWFQNIKKYDKNQYAVAIVKLFGIQEPYETTYSRIIWKDSSLINYLREHIGNIMYTKTDRKELIERINVRRDGRLKKSMAVLNEALAEDNIPYKIRQFETMIRTHGKIHKYKYAWKIEEV